MNTRIHINIPFGYECVCIKVCYTVVHVTESGEWSIHNVECDIVDLLGQQSSSACMLNIKNAFTCVKLKSFKRK